MLLFKSMDILDKTCEIFLIQQGYNETIGEVRFERVGEV